MREAWKACIRAWMSAGIVPPLEEANGVCGAMGARRAAAIGPRGLELGLGGSEMERREGRRGVGVVETGGKSSGGGASEVIVSLVCVRGGVWDVCDKSCGRW